MSKYFYLFGGVIIGTFLGYYSSRYIIDPDESTMYESTQPEPNIIKCEPDGIKYDGIKYDGIKYDIKLNPS